MPLELDDLRIKALDELIDREEIRNCLTRYARGVDRYDPELTSSIYHPDALVDHTVYKGPGRGSAAFANEDHPKYWEAHQHYMLNTTIDLDGTTAHVETYMISVGRRHQNSATDMHGGRYVDRFEKREGKWGIACRLVVYEWGMRSEDAVAQLETFILGTHDKSDPSYLRPLDVFR